MHRGQQRLRYLDGLRGVAIALVVLWHVFGPNDARYLAYGDRFAMLPVVRHGWSGVALFFLLSGFVIFMTIERCSGWLDFMLRRWVRLFPAMLVASLLLFALNRLLMLPGPTTDVDARDLLPGLSFVSPALWHLVLRLPFRSVDEVFWTLYVEAAFYAIFAALYFRMGWRHAVAGLFALFLLTRDLKLGLPMLGASPALLSIVTPLEWLGCQHFGWFASGALFYRAVKDGRPLYAALALAAGLAAAALYDFPVAMSAEIRLLLVSIPLLFAMAHRAAWLQRLLVLPPLLFLGDVSYPLYLVHNNLGLGLTHVFARALPGAAPALWGWLSIAAVVLLAWTIARLAEPALAPAARRLTGRLRDRLARRSGRSRSRPWDGMPPGRTWEGEAR